MIVVFKFVHSCSEIAIVKENDKYIIMLIAIWICYKTFVRFHGWTV